MKKTTANIALVVVTVIWGGGFIATSTALDTFSPFTVMMIRFLGAGILPFFLSWNQWKKLTRKQIFHGMVAGVFLFLAFAFQTFGLTYTSPGKNAFLTATNVVFVPYLMWLLMKQRPRNIELGASIVCVIGIALLTLQGQFEAFRLGDVLSLVCAFFFAVHIIALERCSAQIHVFVLTALQMLTAGVISAVFALLFETWPDHISTTAVGSLAYSIFISTMLAYLLQTGAQKYTTANSAAMILSMEALWAAIFSYFFLQETMSLIMILGACLIFISVIAVVYEPKKSDR